MCSTVLSRHPRPRTGPRADVPRMHMAGLGTIPPRDRVAIGLDRDDLHPVVVGSARTFADTTEHGRGEADAHGFNLMSTTPKPRADFASVGGLERR